MEPIKSLQTKDFIVQMLREEVFSGGLKDGEELAQEVLAEKLGVSRMPVREALQQLELEGVLLRLPNRHMQVVGITPTYIKHNFLVLAAVEKEIVSILVEENRSFQPALDAFKQYEAAVPLQGQEECAKRELEIHTQLGYCLRNPYLAKVHDRLLSGYFAYSLRNFTKDWKVTLKEYRRLFKALKEKDMTTIYEVLRCYFEKAAQAAIGGIANDQFKTN